MLESVLIAAEQTAMLFVLMGFGFAARHFGILDHEGVKRITSLVVNITTPCIVISAFQRPFEADKLPGLGWSLLIAVIWYSFGILSERLFIRGGEDAERRTLKWAVIFSNCGFMGLPLEYAMFGPIGVFYGVVPIAMFNLLAWTYGVSIFRPINGRSDMVKGLLHPTNVAVVLAVALFFLPWRLPKIIATPVNMIGEMNTPLPMLIMGYFLGGAKFSAVFGCLRAYWMLFLRHFAIPLALVGVLAVCPFIPLELRMIAVVPAAAPIGVLLTVFAVQYGGDAEFSTALVATSTLLSILSIPVLVGIARLAF